MNVLVVPTIRETNALEFLNEWDTQDWTIIIVEDNPTKTFRLFNHHHYAWDDIDKELGSKSWIVSHRDSSIRVFGHWMAYKMGARYVFDLDDDCMSIPGVDYIEEHINNLENTSRWTYSVLGQRTRGIPYQNLGRMSNVALSLGLWEGVPDFDSVCVLGGNAPEKIELPKGNRLLAKGQYFPLCGMNLCFKREITPLMYFPLMGEEQPYKRLDDIWCGIIAKKVMDHLDLLVSVGKPFINHKKASNVFVNLVKEASGIAANEHFWEMIDEIDLRGTTPAECMVEIGTALEQVKDTYFSRLGKAIQVWGSLFQPME